MIKNDKKKVRITRRGPPERVDGDFLCYKVLHIISAEVYQRDIFRL